MTRTITVLPRKGSATPRIAETPAGIVWDTGLQNPGLDAFVDEELPRCARPGVPVVVSIGGGTLEEYVRLTSAMQRGSEVAAIEVHLAGRDDELARAVLGAHVDRVTEVVGAVARMSRCPCTRSSPATVGIADLARAAVRAGATGVTVCESPPALGVDADRLRPDLGGVTGWLSGPAVRPLTLRAVFEVAQRPARTFR